MIAQYTIFSQCNITILHSLYYIILKLEGKNDMIFLMDIEKAFDTVQHSFLPKSLDKLENLDKSQPYTKAAQLKS